MPRRKWNPRHFHMRHPDLFLCGSGFHPVDSFGVNIWEAASSGGSMPRCKRERRDSFKVRLKQGFLCDFPPTYGGRSWEDSASVSEAWFWCMVVQPFRLNISADQLESISTKFQAKKFWLIIVCSHFLGPWALATCPCKSWKGGSDENTFFRPTI